MNYFSLKKNRVNGSIMPKAQALDIRFVIARSACLGRELKWEGKFAQFYFLQERLRSEILIKEKQKRDRKAGREMN